MCPGCGTPLIVFELSGVEVDYCPACGGVWLDSGELERIAALAGAAPDRLAQALLSGREGARTRRRCPRCSWRMREVQVGAEAPVTLDRCPAGHGLWFDKGELRGVIEGAGGGEASAVAEFFEDLFRSAT